MVLEDTNYSIENYYHSSQDDSSQDLITIEDQSYRNNLSISDFGKAIARHSVCDFPNENEGKNRQCIMFDAYCEHTGLHYHSIIITIIDNGKIERTRHSVHGDGTLCHPSFISFIISKIKYFEQTRPNFEIFIHRAIVDGPKVFHDNTSCRKIGGWLHPFFVNTRFRFNEKITHK